MNRTNIKGSIAVEAIVMLGLIATMTPILYKQVSERRQDIDNINEANTLLLLKNAAAEYIEANKESISSGTLNPIDIGVDISGYQIGIRKDSSGKIDAMIASAAGGNDMKAAKVASLLGVSAGIYSAQNTEKAWGINGVWAEDISNYGFASLPTGIPVITTAYDKEEASGLNEEQLKDFIENTAFDKFTVKEICIDNPNIPEDERCITDWNIIGINPLEVIAQCNAGTQSACEKGYDKHINRSCSEISIKYKGAGFNAPSGIYKLTTSKTTQVEKACYFVNGELPTAEQLITGAKTDAIARRYDWENGKISTTCASIINNWTSAPTGFYSHVTGINTYNANQPCVFPDTPLATITQCNTANNTNHAACRYGWNKNYNRSCATLLTHYPAGKAKNNTITTASSVSLQCCSCDPCEGLNTACATLNNTCNSAGVGSNACKCAYNRNCNRSCSSVTSYNSSRCGTSNIITTSSSGSGSWQTCSCCPAGGECKTVNGQMWVRSTGTKSYWDSQTFCSNLGMTLKSLAQIQAAGLWNTGSNPFSVTRWHWSTDAYSGCNNCGWIVGLGTNAMIGISRYTSNATNYAFGNTLWNNVYIYALCGPM